MAVVHHRNIAGVKKAYIDTSGRYIISLGKENVLACTRIATEEEIKEKEIKIGETEDEEYQQQLGNLKAPNNENNVTKCHLSPSLAIMFKRPTLGFEFERECFVY